MAKLLELHCCVLSLIPYPYTGILFQYFSYKGPSQCLKSYSHYTNLLHTYNYWANWYSHDITGFTVLPFLQVRNDNHNQKMFYMWLKTKRLICLLKWYSMMYNRCVFVHLYLSVCRLTLRMAGLKLWASLRRELRSCWKPCSSAGEAAEAELCWPVAGEHTCCSRHTLVRVTSSRSHSNNCTSYRDREKGTRRQRKQIINTVTSSQFYSQDHMKPVDFN